MGFDRNKFEKRVQKEFKRKILIGDIYINEYEYSFLCEYLKNSIDILEYDESTKPDCIFTLAAIQIGIRFYDGETWGHFDDLAGYKISVRQRSRIRAKVYKTLAIYEKPLIENNEFVQNILMHGIVSNYYSKNFFDFLYKFYSIDLDRNLNWDGYTEALNLLIDSITEDEFIDKDKVGNRKYMLNEQTKQALKHLSRNSINMRFRWLLKYIDKLTYGEQVNLKSKSRLINQMLLWSNTSDNKVNLDKEYGVINRIRTIRNDYPYIKYKELNDTFYLHIPSLRFTLRRNSDILAKLTIGNNSSIINLGQNELSTILKTNDYKQPLLFNDLFKEITLEVIIDNIIKKYNILIGFDEVIFNEDFESTRIIENKQKLNNGRNIIVTKLGVKLISSVDIKGYKFLEGMIYDLNFEDNQFLLVNDVNFYSVSNKIIEGLYRDLRLSFVKCNSLDAYNKKPYIFFKSSYEKLKGIKYQINKNIYRFDESVIILDDLASQPKEVQAVLNFEKKSLLIGYNNVIIDFPGLSVRKYEFNYIPDLNFEFVEEPYIFKYEGFIDFRNNGNIKSTLESKSNIYKFPINAGSKYNFEYKKDDALITLEIEPPIFCIIKNNEYSNQSIGDIWHKNFDFRTEFKYYKYFEVIVNNNEFLKIKSEKSSDGFYHCSLIQLKSYFLDLDNLFKCDVSVLFDNVIYEYATVYLKTRIISFSSLEFDEENGVIKAKFEKIGEDRIFLTLTNTSTEKIICEYLELTSNNIEVLSEGEAGIYSVDIYILESGFTKRYGKIFTKTIELRTNNFVGVKFDLICHYLSNTRFQVCKYSEYTFLKIIEKLSINEYSAELFSKVNIPNTRQFRIDKICEVYLKIIDFNKYYRSVILCYDEENELMSLLYDKYTKKLVVEEDFSLDSKTRYKRYTDLSEATFDIEIGDLNNVFTSKCIK